MKRTPPEVSRNLQDIRQKADIWRAGIAKARLAGETEKVTYGQAQVAEYAKEMRELLKRSKKQFWER